MYKYISYILFRTVEQVMGPWVHLKSEVINQFEGMTRLPYHGCKASCLCSDRAQVSGQSCPAASKLLSTCYAIAFLCSYPRHLPLSSPHCSTSFEISMAFYHKHRGQTRESQKHLETETCAQHFWAALT